MEYAIIMAKNFYLKNGICYEIIFRKWRWAKDGIHKVFAKNKKALSILIKTEDCNCENP